MTTRFDHVGISVPDLEAATAWYRTALGLTAAPVFRIPDTSLRGVMLLHESGYRIELLHRPTSHPGPTPATALEAANTQGYGHICLCVDNVDEEYARLVAAGAGISMPPTAAPRPGARMAFVKDPYGNLIELLDRAP